MRTDARMDRKQVKLPCASTLGFDKWKAQFGDMVMFREGHNLELGRIISRINYAPVIGDDSPAIRGWLCVAVFSQDMSFIMERWINPETIERCYTPRPQQIALMSFMFGEEFKKHDTYTLREWANTLSSGGILPKLSNKSV